MSETQSGQWYVRTAWFCDGGKSISGPYSTREDAITARVTIERITRRDDLWIDSLTGPYKCGIHSEPVAAVADRNHR